MAQILDNANVRLNLRKEGRCLFNIEGHLVSQSPLKIEQVPLGNFVNEHHRKQIYIVLRHRTSSEILGLSNNSILEMFFLILKFKNSVGFKKSKKQKQTF